MSATANQGERRLREEASHLGFWLKVFGAEVTLDALLGEILIKLGLRISIIDVVVATLPLTAAVTLIVVCWRSGKRNPIGLAVILILAGSVGRCFGLGEELRPATFDFSGQLKAHGFLTALPWALATLVDFWTAYHGVLFVKACVVGALFGWKLTPRTATHGRVISGRGATGGATGAGQPGGGGQETTDAKRPG